MTWHYQWMVLHDFVERITEKGIVAKILEQGRSFYRFKKDALYAGGVLRGRVPARPQHGARGLQPQPHLHARRAAPGDAQSCCFRFTGLSGGIIGDLAPNPPTAPLPIPVLSSNWIIDWRRFYQVRADANPAGVTAQSPRESSIRSSCRSCTRCRAAAAACRSAI